MSRSQTLGGPAVQPTAQPNTDSSFATMKKTQMLKGTSRLHRYAKPMRHRWMSIRRGWAATHGRVMR